MTKPTKLSEAELEGLRAYMRYPKGWDSSDAHRRLEWLMSHADAQAAELAAKDAEIARLAEENRRLREALGPFAKESDAFYHKHESERFLLTYGVTVGDFRRAAKAMDGAG